MSGTTCDYINKFLDFVDDVFYKLSRRPERPTGEMLSDISDESHEGNRRDLECAKKDRLFPYCSEWPEGEMLLGIHDESHEGNRRALATV